MAHEKWFRIAAYNTQSIFCFGTEKEVDTYLDLINEGRRINLYGATEIPADECGALDSGADTDGFRLDLAIDTIRENRAEQAAQEARALRG